MPSDGILHQTDKWDYNIMLLHINMINDCMYSVAYLKHKAYCSRIIFLSFTMC